MPQATLNASALLNLPPELLHEIISHAMPESFITLLVTCRAIHECAKPLVPVYKARKHAFSTLVVDSRTDRRGILLCLNRIAQNPDILRYATFADLSFAHSATRGCRPSRDVLSTAPYREFARIRESNGALWRIGEFIEHAPCLRSAGVDTNAWARRMLDPIFDVAEGQCDCYFDSIESQLFLLSVLKNVRTLRLTVTRSLTMNAGVQDFQLVLDTIKHLQAKQPTDAPLGKLRTLQSFPTLDYDTWQHFNSVGFFLTIPSLEELYVTSYLALKDRYESIFSWPKPMLEPSNLRQIELLESCFDEEGVAALVSGTPFLHTFRLCYAIKHHGQGYDFNPARIFRTLGKHAGKTLRQLAMTLQPNFYGTIENGVVSLREFTSLETLQVDYRMFYGPSMESGERNGTNPCLPTAGRDAIWKPVAIPPLTEILPRELHKLELFLGESPYAGGAERFDQDTCLHALFGIPSSKNSSNNDNTKTTIMPQQSLSQLSQLPKCSVFCVSSSLSTKQYKSPDRSSDDPSSSSARSGSSSSDQVRDQLEAMGVHCFINSPEDPSWVRSFKQRFDIESW